MLITKILKNISLKYFFLVLVFLISLTNISFSQNIINTSVLVNVSSGILSGKYIIDNGGELIIDIGSATAIFDDEIIINSGGILTLKTGNVNCTYTGSPVITINSGGQLILGRNAGTFQIAVSSNDLFISSATPEGNLTIQGGELIYKGMTFRKIKLIKDLMVPSNLIVVNMEVKSVRSGR